MNAYSKRIEQNLMLTLHSALLLLWLVRSMTNVNAHSLDKGYCMVVAHISFFRCGVHACLKYHPPSCCHGKLQIIRSYVLHDDREMRHHRYTARVMVSPHDHVLLEAVVALC